MQRIAFFLYGAFAHGLFLGVYAYLAAFVSGLNVPRPIDGTPALGTPAALAVNLGLLLLFGLQHSVMARPAFKRWWTRFVPAPLERSTYVLASNAVLFALFAAWQPLPGVLWDVQNPALRTALWSLCVFGWVLVPAASLLINHFDLFGTRQVWLHLNGRSYTHLPFRTPWLYRHVRHPLYVGWLIAFWATPSMNAGHALFAAFMTLYILVAIRFEERDLAAQHGKAYLAYRSQVPMLIPSLTPAAVDEHAAAKAETRLMRGYESA